MLIDAVIRVIEPPLKAIFKLYRMTDYRPKAKVTYIATSKTSGDDTPERKLAA